MKTLAKLIRYHRYLVDEKRREVKDLEERAAALEQSIDRLDAQVVAERISAGETDLGSADYGPFREGDVRHSLADTGRAQERLGYAPAVDVATGLSRTAAWFLAEHRDEHIETGE